MVSKKRSLRRWSGILLAYILVFTMPIFAFAEGGKAADPIKVFMTISDQGMIASDNDGQPMAWREVTVEDLDSSGDFTFYEALVAAHKAYNKAAGFEVDDTSGWVNSLWSKAANAASYSFLRNDQATPVVTKELISAGDHLEASVNQDFDFYADWASAFDIYTKEVNVGESFSLTLKGFQAMSINAPAPAEGVNIGIINNGKFEKINNAVTDKNGTATLSFDKAGTYVVTAQGAARDLIKSESWGPFTDCGVDKEGKTIFGLENYSTNEKKIGYTKTNYGTGPYPYEELEWVDSTAYVASEFNQGFLMYSGDILKNCPLIAPCCVVTVKEKTSISGATVTAKNQTYTGKALTPAVTVEMNGKTLVKDTDYTVAYSNNKDAGTAKITVTGKGGYKDTASGKFVINKAAQKMKVTKKTFKVKAKAIKNKPKTIKPAKLITVKKATGKKTYVVKPYGKKAKKVLKCSKTKVIVKKGTKRGNYKVKITVKAAGNKNYKAKTKTVISTIKVVK